MHRVERQTKPILSRPVFKRQTAAAATTTAHRSARLFEFYFTRRAVDRIIIQTSQLIVNQSSIQLRIFAQYLVVVAIQIDIVIRSEFNNNIPARLRQIVSRAELILSENRRIARIHLFVEYARIGGQKPLAQRTIFNYNQIINLFILVQIVLVHVRYVIQALVQIAND